MTFQQHNDAIGREGNIKYLLKTLTQLADADGIIKTRQLVDTFSTIDGLEQRLSTLVDCHALQPYDRRWLDTDLPKAYLFVKKNAPKFREPKVTRGERFEDLKVFLDCDTGYKYPPEVITEIASRMAAE